MQFRVVPATGRDHSTPPHRLRFPGFAPLGPAGSSRQVSLNEVDSEILDDVGPRAALLGVVDGEGSGVPLGWGDTITENPEVGATEVWEIFNFTEDAHPIHIHEVQFQVVDRQTLDGPPRPPEPWEAGFKDTVIAFPDEITRVKARFGIAGLFVWHCHIVEHEDHEMMRPYRIGSGSLDI